MAIRMNRSTSVRVNETTTSPQTGGERRTPHEYSDRHRIGRKGALDADSDSQRPNNPASQTAATIINQPPLAASAIHQRSNDIRIANDTGVNERQIEFQIRFDTAPTVRTAVQIALLIIVLACLIVRRFPERGPAGDGQNDKLSSTESTSDGWRIDTIKTRIKSTASSRMQSEEAG